MLRVFLYLSIAISLAGPSVAQDRSQGRSMVILRNGIVGGGVAAGSAGGVRILGAGGCGGRGDATNAIWESWSR